MWHGERPLIIYGLAMVAAVMAAPQAAGGGAFPPVDLEGGVVEGNLHLKKDLPPSDIMDVFVRFPVASLAL